MTTTPRRVGTLVITYIDHGQQDFHPVHEWDKINVENGVLTVADNRPWIFGWPLSALRCFELVPYEDDDP